MRYGDLVEADRDSREAPALEAVLGNTRPPVSRCGTCGELTAAAQCCGEAV